LVSPPPLDTGDISVFAYYQHVDGITLSDTLAAFQSFTQYGNYVDGTVRVWDSHNIGASSPYRGADGESTYGFANYSASDHGDTYVDVNVRVRADGWVLAWFTRSQNFGRLVWWGRTDGSYIPRNAQPPLSYNTRLARAVDIVLRVMGVTNLVFSNVCYYDFEHTDAKRICIFGCSKQESTGFPPINKYYYVTVPNGVTVKRVWLTFIARMGAAVSADYSRYYMCRGYFDGALKYDHYYAEGAYFDYCFISGGGGSHTANIDLTSVLTVGVQHSILAKTGRSSNAGTSVGNFRANRQVQAVVVETT